MEIGAARLWVYGLQKILAPYIGLGLKKDYVLIRYKLYFTLYHSQDMNTVTDFILAVQINNFLSTGTEGRMTAFEGFHLSRFNIIAFACRPPSLMGYKITQHADCWTTLCQGLDVGRFGPQLLSSATGLKGYGEFRDEQATVYRQVIDKLLFLARMSAPLRLLHAFMAASKLRDLITPYLRALASKIVYLLKQGPILR